MSIKHTYDLSKAHIKIFILLISVLTSCTDKESTEFVVGKRYSENYITETVGKPYNKIQIMAKPTMNLYDEPDTKNLFYYLYDHDIDSMSVIQYTYYDYNEKYVLLWFIEEKDSLKFIESYISDN